MIDGVVVSRGFEPDPTGCSLPGWSIFGESMCSILLPDSRHIGVS